MWREVGITLCVCVCVCVHARSESSTDERFLYRQKIFIQVKVKGQGFRCLGHCFCLFAGSAGIFLLSFWHRSMVRSDQLIEKENINETAQNFSSDWPFRENLGLRLRKKRTKTTVKKLPLLFFPWPPVTSASAGSHSASHHAAISRPAAFLWEQMCPLRQPQVVRDLCPRLVCLTCNCSVAEGRTGKC